MAGTNAGTITYAVEADTSKLKADVAKAEGEVNAAGEVASTKATDAIKKQSEAADTLGGKLRGIKKTYGEQIEVVQGLIGKIAAVGAIAVTFYKIGEAISTYVIARLQTAKENMEAFRQTLDKTNAQAAQLTIANKFDELNQRLYETETQFRPLTNLILDVMPTIGGIVADDANKIRDELKNLNDITAATANNLRRIRENAKQAAIVDDQRKAVDEFTKLREQSRLDSMTEEERIVAEGEAKIVEVMAAWNRMAAEDRIRTAQATEDLIAEIRRKAASDAAKKAADAAEEARKKAEDERKKEEDWWDKVRDWNKEQEDNARKVREAWVSSLKAIREESNKAFSTDQAASMTQFAQQLQFENITATANMNRIIVEGVG